MDPRHILFILVGAVTVAILRFLAGGHADTSIAFNVGFGLAIMISLAGGVATAMPSAGSVRPEDLRGHFIGVLILVPLGVGAHVFFGLSLRGTPYHWTAVLLLATAAMVTMVWLWSCVVAVRTAGQKSG